MGKLFPEQFADLEPIAAPWVLPDYTARYMKRVNTPIEELEAFYKGVFPRAKEIIAYCDGFDIKNPPEEVRALLKTIYALCVVSFPVEIWKTPRLPDSGSTAAQLGSYNDPVI